MMDKRFPLHMLTIMLALCLLTLADIKPSVQAQTDNGASCPLLVEQALSELGSNCTGMERNSACYGYDKVETSFSQAMPEGFFSQPADKTDLATVASIKTVPLSLSTSEWGIAVLNVQANVPETLPGQAVTFLLLGDTEIENAVPPGAAYTGPATAILQSATDLFTDPNASSTLIQQLPPGTVLQFESKSADGEWLKVTTGSGSGWISRDAVNQTSTIENLPVEGAERMSPMQAFYFRNGIGDVSCAEAPSVLAVRSPENITVDLSVNGAEIRLGSLITLQTLPGNMMRLTTIEGNAILDPNSDNPVSVPEGFTTTHCLAPAEDLGSDGQANDQELGTDCTWEQPIESTLEEIGEGLIVQTLLQELGLDENQQLPEPTPVIVDECPFGTTIVHTVSAGENLYRIGLRYRTGMGAIMSANGLSNPQLIYTGQQLVIPCGVETGLPSVPPTLLPPVTPEPGTVGVVDCRPFSATSPLDGLAYGSTTFYWDAAPGATGYNVNVYNLDEENGALVASFTTSGGNTNLTADLSIDSIGYGFSFAWEVNALFNGQVACSSIRYTVPRAPQPGGQPATTSGGLTVSWSCISGVLTVNYANVPATDTSVVINFTDSMAGAMGGTFAVPPTTATQIFSIVFTVSAGSVASFPSGSSGVLTPAVLNC